MLPVARRWYPDHRGSPPDLRSPSAQLAGLRSHRPRWRLPGKPKEEVARERVFMQVKIFLRTVSVAVRTDKRIGAWGTDI